jgi:hypothetical protein
MVFWLSFFLCAHLALGNWSNDFLEQGIFVSNACQKSSKTNYIYDQIDFRLNSKGQFVFKGDSPDVSRNESLNSCSQLCANNSKCVAFSFESKRNLCLFLTNCRLDSKVDGYRYFVKKRFGCNALNVQVGFGCDTSDELFVEENVNSLLIENCMAVAKANNYTAFVRDRNSKCSYIKETCTKIPTEDSSIYTL